MNPVEYDFTVYRGTDFDVTLLAQRKHYLFNDRIPTPGDAKRSLAENLKYYGYKYSYINFLAEYDSAEMTIRKMLPDNSTILMKLNLDNGGLSFTDKGVRILFISANTRNIDAQVATYTIDLYKGDRVDRLAFGKIDFIGEV